jgi:uncharacterized membrane protein
MFSPIFKYSLKVWLTSILLSPVIFVLLLAVTQSVNIKELLKQGTELIALYLLYVAAQLAMSFLVWLAFWLIIRVIANIPCTIQLQKGLILFAGMILTIVSFTTVLSCFGMLNDGSGFINLMYANCFCIGWGVWYYDLNPATV